MICRTENKTAQEIFFAVLMNFFCSFQGGDPPQPRAAHTCAVLGNKGYIFGGRVLVIQYFLDSLIIFLAGFFSFLFCHFVVGEKKKSQMSLA